jgi:hypothetical protein
LPVRTAGLSTGGARKNVEASPTQSRERAMTAMLKRVFRILTAAGKEFAVDHGLRLPADLSY